jgi:hypothetical protein
MTPAPYSYTPKPGSRAWVTSIAALLRDGFGVEDIAIKLSCHPDQVRKMVAVFRREGLMAKWFRK